MGQRGTSVETNQLFRAVVPRRPYRPESSIKQVGYLLVLAVASAAVMFAGLGLLDVLLDTLSS
jgi:hypothetical protein